MTLLIWPLILKKNNQTQLYHLQTLLLIWSVVDRGRRGEAWGAGGGGGGWEGWPTCLERESEVRSEWVLMVSVMVLKFSCPAGCMYVCDGYRPEGGGKVAERRVHPPRFRCSGNLLWLVGSSELFALSYWHQYLCWDYLGSLSGHMLALSSHCLVAHQPVLSLCCPLGQNLFWEGICIHPLFQELVGKVRAVK